MTKPSLKEIYEKRPFKIRNADEYDLSQILDIFVPPSEGLEDPFEFENLIVRGKMGSGKTMYLKANFAFYLYSMVPALLEGQDGLILPVSIKLNDFQHISEPKQIYNEVVVRIIEEIVDAHQLLKNAETLASIHRGIQTLPSQYFERGIGKKLSSIAARLKKLTAEEYVEKITTEMGAEGSASLKFMQLSAAYKHEHIAEIKAKVSPGISDIKNVYDQLLRARSGKILLLIDEAGSLDKSFYQRGRETSFFETLMNQLRTTDFIRTKIAIYPHSYQDILAETRYGDLVRLVENIKDEEGYKRFYHKTKSLIKKYLVNIDPSCDPNNIFELDDKVRLGGSLEQVINASNGSIRRLVQLLDNSMSEAYNRHGGHESVVMLDVLSALKRNAGNMADLFTDTEKEFLEDIAKVCKSRKTFTFRFPYKAPALSKYTSKSEEDNIVGVVEVGSGRRGTQYCFDYAYCVLKDIPTHYQVNSEAIDKQRSWKNGVWISRVADISESMVVQAKIAGKIEGEVDFITNDSGFIKGEDGEDYYFSKSMLIEEDKDKNLQVATKVRFYPMLLSGSKMAHLLEVI